MILVMVDDLGFSDLGFHGSEIETPHLELNDLSDQHPEKVRELAAKWDAWAERAKVYPKRPEAELAKQDRQPQAEPNPPQVRGQPISITAIVGNPNPRGVVLAHGGVRFGYSLHFVDGRPAFSIRNEGELTELVAGKPVSGRVTIVAKLDEEVMSISIDDKLVVQRKSPGLLKGQPVIGLYSGRDHGDPVGNYKVPNEFNGRIASFRIEAGVTPVAMRTPWGEQLEQDSDMMPWNEYPRPALRRDDWVNLNGTWDYAVTSNDVESAPETWDGEIRVPFAIESPLFGVERRLAPDEALWYRRTVTATKPENRRLRLNLEAVDYWATVWVNDQRVGEHVGGNLPFSFDVTDALRDGDNTIILRVTDATDTAYQLHGKQRLNPRGIWYTPVSGIW